MTADLPPAMRFEDLVGEVSDTDGVTLPRGGSGFGRSALRYHGKIFAMVARGDLVVKLPGGRSNSPPTMAQSVPQTSLSLARAVSETIGAAGWLLTRA